jgi:hypothetical protein
MGGVIFLITLTVLLIALWIGGLRRGLKNSRGDGNFPWVGGFFPTTPAINLRPATTPDTTAIHIITIAVVDVVGIE